MTNTLSDFYPQLLTHPEIQELVQTHFEDEGAQILQGLRDGSLGKDEAEELEAIITEFFVDHGEEVKTYTGLGGSGDSQQPTMAYFEKHHPEAKALIDKMGGAPGFEASEFIISVLRYGSLYVVAAEEFEDAWFVDEKLALDFAEANYEPWIRNYENSRSAE